jgi:CheY-like chemotaxis protein
MAGKRIVLIDDDPDVQAALRLMLEPAGYELRSLSTGPEGLAAVREDRPDLILLDIMLSSQSEGFHLAYELKNDEVTSDIPIVMISSIGETLGIDYSQELGSDYLPVEKFLEKPLTRDVVLSAVREALEKCAES